jgi:hypothetical protein
MESIVDSPGWLITYPLTYFSGVCYKSQLPKPIKIVKSFVRVARHMDATRIPSNCLIRRVKMQFSVLDN